MLIIVGADGTGPGIANGVHEFTDAAPPITVTATEW